MDYPTGKEFPPDLEAHVRISPIVNAALIPRLGCAALIPRLGCAWLVENSMQGNICFQKETVEPHVVSCLGYRIMFSKPNKNHQRKPELQS